MPTTSCLRLLSYNIQTGVTTRAYRQYLTQLWRHFLPHPERTETLDRIATVLGEYDIVGLQEVDSGSLRSGFINQTAYLARSSGFPYWHDHINRDFGHLARHSLGILSRVAPAAVDHLRLPGMIPGRGALMLRFGAGEEALHLIVVHLALSRRARLQQLSYIAERVRGLHQVVIMGDFNCSSESMEMCWLLQQTGLREPCPGLPTFPSWQPARNIDHILVSQDVRARGTRVLGHTYSDHLAIEMQIEIPCDISLHREKSYPLSTTTPRQQLAAAHS